MLSSLMAAYLFVWGVKSQIGMSHRFTHTTAVSQTDDISVLEILLHLDRLFFFFNLFVFCSIIIPANTKELLTGTSVLFNYVSS